MSETSTWSSKKRLVVAVPGVMAAVALVVGGVLLVVTGIRDLRSLPEGDDFGSLSGAMAWVGVLAVVVGLVLAGLTAGVTARRPRRSRLVLAAVVAFSGAALATYVLATGADGMVYAPLAAVQAYLGLVALLRTLSIRQPGP